MNVLEISGLTKEFRAGGWTSRSRRSVSALDSVDLDLRQGEWLGVVGESGSGKTTLARIVAGLERATEGKVTVHGKNVTNLSYRKRRGMAHEIQLVFQDAGGALNPKMTIAAALSEPLRIHRTVRRGQELEAEVNELLELVGLDASLGARTPRHLSGGQRQRVSIARALALKPNVLLLDEPVSSLDVSVQAQMLNMLLDLQTHTDISVLMISHDLALVSAVCDRVAVMYMGNIVETGRPQDLVDGAKHPYTVDLLEAVPSVEHSREAWLDMRREEYPDPATPPSGCRYRMRCQFADAQCATKPELSLTSGEHQVACHHPRFREMTC